MLLHAISQNPCKRSCTLSIVVLRILARVYRLKTISVILCEFIDLSGEIRTAAADTLTNADLDGPEFCVTL
jgi:hypothetical protein